MRKYSPFVCLDKTFSLDHLNAFYVEYKQPPTKDKSELKYRCLVEFSIHCFTKSPNIHKNETLLSYESSLHYKTPKETRIFCYDRYLLSLELPNIFREKIVQQKCFFTSANDKYLTISIKNREGNLVDYEIYFSLKKSKECDIHIFINSAYVRSVDYHRNTTKIRRKPISFFVLLYNTLNNKKIKKPI